jgi:hypothetical protein
VNFSMLPSGKKYHDSNMLVFVLAAWAVQHQTKKPRNQGKYNESLPMSGSHCRSVAK